jgi:hypothetical protein
MFCEYILKETIDRKGNFYNGAPWVHCSQKLETHGIQSSLVRCCCLRNLLGWGQMLPSSDSFLMTSPKQAWRVTWNLMWYCLSINVILLLCLWCLLAVVDAKSWLVPGCSRQADRLL